MIRFICTLLCLVFLLSNSRSQTVDSVIAMADSLTHAGDVESAIGLVDSLWAIIDFKYYELRYIESQEIVDSDARLRALIQVRNIPYWRYKNADRITRGGEIYKRASRELIELCSGDIKLLQAITVHPGYKAYVYPFLKHEIEKSGGKWDKGDIPIPHLDPPLQFYNNEKH